MTPAMTVGWFHWLQREHAAMREKLHELESAMKFGSAGSSAGGTSSQPEVKKLCLRLSRQLSTHRETEGQLAARCSLALGRMGPDVLARLALEHHMDQDRLDIINQSIADESPQWFSYAGPMLTGLIAGLRREMEAQELDLFPFMEQALGGNGNGNGHSNGSVGMTSRNGAGLAD